MTTIIFFVFAVTAIGAAIAMIFQRNPVYSCLWLVTAFFALAGLYVLLGSPFIAAIQIIVYAGAIMVLFLFVIMLLNLASEERERPKRPKFLPFAVALGVMLLLELGWLFKHAPAAALPPFGGETTVEEIGTKLFTDYLYPFELSSVLILAAIIGAVMLAKRKI